jgi:putative ABC transport system substrate-binding protein
VFVVGTDPVRTGLVGDLRHPGGNVTGVSTFLQELAKKRLGLLQELVPRAVNIAVMVEPTNPGSEMEAEDILEAAPALGKQITILQSRTERDLDAALKGLAGAASDALLVTANPFFFTHADRIISAAAALRIPGLYSRREFRRCRRPDDLWIEFGRQYPCGGRLRGSNP